MREQNQKKKWKGKILREKNPKSKKIVRDCKSSQIQRSGDWQLPLETWERQAWKIETWSKDGEGRRGEWKKQIEIPTFFLIMLSPLSIMQDNFAMLGEEVLITRTNERIRDALTSQNKIFCLVLVFLSFCLLSFLSFLLLSRHNLIKSLKGSKVTFCVKILKWLTDSLSHWARQPID